MGSLISRHRPVMRESLERSKMIEEGDVRGIWRGVRSVCSQEAAEGIQINRLFRCPPVSLSWQVWASEVSKRCIFLLNSQDGGILTVSVS